MYCILNYKKKTEKHLIIGAGVGKIFRLSCCTLLRCLLTSNGFYNPGN